MTTHRHPRGWTGARAPTPEEATELQRDLAELQGALPDPGVRYPPQRTETGRRLQTIHRRYDIMRRIRQCDERLGGDYLCDCVRWIAALLEGADGRADDYRALAADAITALGAGITGEDIAADFRERLDRLDRGGQH